MSVVSEERQVPVLSYARPAPWYHRRRRWFYALAMLIITGGLLWRGYGGALKQRVRYLQVQRQCMEHNLPADTPVYAEDAEGIARVLALGRDSAIHRDIIRDTPRAPACYRGPSYARQFFAEFSLPQALSWEEYVNAFLHRMRRPDGTERLVCIDFRVRMARELEIGPVVRVCRPATLRTRPARMYLAWSPIAELERAPIGGYSAFGTIRIFAGQIDPADPAHFTIDYVQGGKRHRIDGRLTDDDRVRLLQDGRHMLMREELYGDDGSVIAHGLQPRFSR